MTSVTPILQNVTINRPHALNEFEILLVGKYMQEKSPGVHYTMTPGNNCIWVYYGSINMYFIFRDGKIVDVQID